jgi:serine phosphatase RsbU (regulator of sigma subunit)
MLIDHDGGIQAHTERQRIAFNSVTKKATAAQSIYGLLDRESDHPALAAALHEADSHPKEVATRWVHLDGKRQLVAVAYIPELKWYVVSAVDMATARIIDSQWLTGALVLMGLMLALLLAGFGLSLDRLVLRPISRLTLSAEALAQGSYDVALPPAGDDEVGALTRAFNVMVQRVRSHTAELENRVSERTHALENTNRLMVAAHKQIEDSINYASLIQRAILPDRQLLQSLGERHFVLWRPRDVVGGDFYVFRADGDNYLVGVVDCAGHSVPGALMTMLARAAIDHAIQEVGAADPAAILTHTEATVRAMLEDTTLPRAIATNMDAGLAYVDRAAGRVVFSGARISLYHSDGQTVGEVKGLRRALMDRRPGAFTNVDVPLGSGQTYYLTTDGFLDQAGGKDGFGFGNSRFADLLKQNAGLPLADQATAFLNALSQYQGDRPQRDDITVLSFKFE